MSSKLAKSITGRSKKPYLTRCLTKAKKQYKKEIDMQCNKMLELSRSYPGATMDKNRGMVNTNQYTEKLGRLSARQAVITSTGSIGSTSSDSDEEEANFEAEVDFSTPLTREIQIGDWISVHTKPITGKACSVIGGIVLQCTGFDNIDNWIIYCIDTAGQFVIVNRRLVIIFPASR